MHGKRFPWLRVILIVLLVLISTVAIALFYVRSRIQQPPEWWAPADALSQDVIALGEQVENSVVTNANRARPGGNASHSSSGAEPDIWVLRLSEDEVNAWLATRLPKWAANQYPGSFLAQDVGEMHVRIEDGLLRIGARVGAGAGTKSAVGADVGQSIGIAFAPIRQGDGTWGVEIVESLLGRLSVPLSRGLEVFSQMDGGATIPPEIDRLLQGEGIEVSFSTKKSRRHMTLADLELTPGEIVLHWRVERN